jgi:hypothetical protein
MPTWAPLSLRVPLESKKAIARRRCAASGPKSTLPQRQRSEPKPPQPPSVSVSSSVPHCTAEAASGRCGLPPPPPPQMMIAFSANAFAAFHGAELTRSPAATLLAPAVAHVESLWTKNAPHSARRRIGPANRHKRNGRRAAELSGFHLRIDRHRADGTRPIDRFRLRIGAESELAFYCCAAAQLGGEAREGTELRRAEEDPQGDQGNRPHPPHVHVSWCASVYGSSMCG